MITREANLMVKKDENGVYFYSKDTDLEKETVVLPCLGPDGAMGTVEFSKRKVIYNPANSPSLTVTSDQFMKMFEN